MFGGVGFFLHGNMLVGTTGGRFAGRLLVRVGKAGEAAALKEPNATAVAMGRRRIGGYVFVAADAVKDRRVLRRWLRRAVDYVATLPKKAAPKRIAKTSSKANSRATRR